MNIPKSTSENLNIFLKFNPILAYFFASLPVFCMIFALFLPNTAVNIQLFYIVWMFIYVVIFLSFLAANFKWIKQATTKNKLIIAMLVICALLINFVILSAVVTKSFSAETLCTLSYVFLFSCVFLLNKKQIKIFLHILFASVCFCFVVNMLDPAGKVVSYFADPNLAKYSSVFGHSNYSSTVASVLIIVASNIMLFLKQKWQIFVYAIYFIILSTFIYLNAAFAGITAVYFILFVEFIVLWVKNKKFPWQIILVTIAFAGISLLLELIPNIHQYSSSQYNYFIELTAVFDNIFHTHLLQDIFHIEFVAGADGWNRGTLLKNALFVACGGNETGFFAKCKTILFGTGADSVSTIRPHNLFVGCWLDYGLIFALLLIISLVLMFIFIMKNIKGKTDNVFPFLFACVGYLFVTIFGSMKAYHVIYFVAMLALALKYSFNKDQKTLIN